ncbi:MAG TPA: Uma2 family endonuclease [Bacteroidetes bacterium]|nr:Uma2 family endonuclease [Bacteroidota bacterium]
MNDENIFLEESTVGTTEEASYEPDYETERNKPMPSKNHGIIQSRLIIALGVSYLDQYEFISEVKLALPGVKPSIPDISIFPKESVDLLEDEIQMTEPPLTVIEILSPKQSIDDIKNKIFDIYFPAGVRSAWLIIPTLRTVYIFTPDRSYDIFTEGKLHDPATGIELELDSFFP